MARRELEIDVSRAKRALAEIAEDVERLTAQVTDLEQRRDALVESIQRPSFAEHCKGDDPSLMVTIQAADGTSAVLAATTVDVSRRGEKG